MYKVQLVAFGILPAMFLATLLGGHLGFVRMNFHLCEQKWMLKNVPYKFQLQILKFGVKLNIYLCSGIDPSRAVLKNGIRNGTIGREIAVVQLLGYVNLEGVQVRGKFFSI